MYNMWEPLGKGDRPVSEYPTVEQIARDYHEICREMVNKETGMITKPTSPYIEWDDLTPEQREGRYFIARGLLERYHLFMRKIVRRNG